MRAPGPAGVLRGATLVSGALLAALAPLTVLDVTLRYVFDAPLRGSFELTQLAMVAIVFLGLGDAQRRGEHITIDLVVDRLGPGMRRWVERCARGLSVVLAAAATWQLIELAVRTQRAQEISGVLGVPVAVAVALASMGMALFTWALLADR